MQKCKVCDSCNVPPMLSVFIDEKGEEWHSVYCPICYKATELQYSLEEDATEAWNNDYTLTLDEHRALQKNEGGVGDTTISGYIEDIIGG